MTKVELFAKIDSTWLSTKKKQELKTSVEEYTKTLISAKPLVSCSGNKCPHCGNYGIIQDGDVSNSTCPCLYC